jgi:heterodisulfide reductase subunit A2
MDVDSNTYDKTLESRENLLPENQKEASAPNMGKNGRAKPILVIGGGIAGIQASLDLADAGLEVYLIERSSSVGGRMAQLDKTFPTLDCSSCILTPKMADITRKSSLHLLTCSEVVNVEGEAGDFSVTVRKQPRYVDVDICTGCGSCVEVCPVDFSSDFNVGLETHKAIYRRFPQAIPAAFVIEKHESPCKNACPAQIPVQGYVALIAQGKFTEALNLIRNAGIPFAGTLGRVCYHPCEDVCKRGEWDEAVSICALKRFCYDEGRNGTEIKPATIEHEERVAIVGAGPSGLTAAYQLLHMGYQVTVFDELPIPGGMLATGIPEYRLPRDVLAQEIEDIKRLGAEFKFNTPIGKENGLKIEDLQKEYQAVYLAIGAHGSSRLRVPGEELPGVMQAVPFLRKLNMGEDVRIGNKVVVVGGGNSAIDAARCALRMGSEVKLVYRRSRAEMPAASFEVAAAEEEGVELNFLMTPVRVLEKDGKAVGIECVHMELGEPDESGRRRPVPIEGSEFLMEVDTVIAAIGQNVLSEGLGVETKWGNIIVDDVTLETSLPGVFAGGDAVIGPASVVEAIGAGKQAAESIQRYLRKIDLYAGRRSSWKKPDPVSYKAESKEMRAPRKHMSELALDDRLVGFKEVELGFTQEQAMAEAKRCLDCAVCSECMQCVTVCQAHAIRHDDQPEDIQLQVGSIIVATGYDVFDPIRKPEFGFGSYPEVITTMEFERLVSASGPTAGKIVLNGKTPRRIVFIQCVGSRDLSLDLPNCSRVCCMAVAKQAHLAHDRIDNAEVTVFYMDVRAFGKGFEEFYDRVREEGIIYRRGNPSEIRRHGEGVVVVAEDTLLGELVEVEADLVVLAVGMLPRQDAQELALTLGINQDSEGYFLENHPKLRTVSSSKPGIFLAGCSQGPKDIPDTVAHAKAAASAAMILSTRKGASNAQN